MAIKKNELYSSLWASCDKLRGGMDASQYKDYILTLLFVKYVTDKFEGVKYPDINIPEGGSFDDIVALKGKKNIGEGIDVIIAKLAEANDLRGVIDNAHFNDETKLGKGQEMVDKLTGLVAIFQRKEFDFKNNKAGGDDILGDAYEYLMRNFATESGKSKGQFYTPAEVSRVLAKVVGIDKIEFRSEGYSVYDPACGSGSLLIRAADEAPFEVSIWGQEKEVTTAGLAKMNLVLHNKASGEIKAGNTFSDPQYFEDNSADEVLKRFDLAVVNPPFSLKNWKDGLREYGRFDGYGDKPPEKNGDFAWLLHILKSLKTTGKAAVILRPTASCSAAMRRQRSARRSSTAAISRESSGFLPTCFTGPASRPAFSSSTKLTPMTAPDHRLNTGIWMRKACHSGSPMRQPAARAFS